MLEFFFAYAAHYVEQVDGSTAEEMVVYDLLFARVNVAKLCKKNANFTLSTFGFIFKTLHVVKIII